MGAPFGTAMARASGMAGQAGRRDLPDPPRNEVGVGLSANPTPAFSASWAPIGTTSPEWRPKPLFLPGRFRGTRPDLGRQEESTAARTSWPGHMPADQQGSPGYERGAHRAPREPSGECSPRAGYRSVGTIQLWAAVRLRAAVTRPVVPRLLLGPGAAALARTILLFGAGIALAPWP